VDYTKYNNLASRLIEKWGRPFAVEIATAGTYDPVTDTHSDTKIQVDLKGVMLNFNERDIDGTLIQVGDKSLMLETNDELLNESGKMRIITHFFLDANGDPVLDPSGHITYASAATSLIPLSIVPLEPGGEVILYKVHARG
jgi:hypothetical protein